MKSVFFKTIQFVITIFALIFSYKYIVLIRKCSARIYTLWIGKEFQRIGEGCLIEPLEQFVGGVSISIGDNTRIQRHGTLTAWSQCGASSFTPQICIGNNVNIGKYVHITAVNKISIGNNVLMGKFVTITDNSHGQTDLSSLEIPPLEREIISKGEIIIEDDVWIGDKATILPGCIIGRGSVIGANSVVTKDIPAYSVACGNPAKIIK